MLVLRLALAAGSGGTAQWSAVFDPRRRSRARTSTCPPSARSTSAPGSSSTASPSSCRRCRCTPPGTRRACCSCSMRSGSTRRAAMAALCIGVGALSGPLAYLLARQVLDERRARVATLLLAMAPGALLFGATSADAVYLTLGLLAAWPLAARSWTARAAGAVILAAGSLFAWSLPAVGAWAAIADAAPRRPARRAGAQRRCAAWRCSCSTRCCTPRRGSTRSARCARPRTSTARASLRPARTGSGSWARRSRSSSSSACR